MASAKIGLHYRKKKDGTKIHRLVVRVTIDRVTNYDYSGYDINPIDFDEIREMVKTSHPKYRYLNKLMRKKFDKIDDIIFDLETNNKRLSAKEIIDLANNKPKASYTFYDVAEEFCENYESQNKFNQAISSRGYLTRLKDFLNNKEIKFENIDVKFLKRFESYLKTVTNLSDTSIFNILSFIRTIYNIAISDGLVDISCYPFGKKIGKKKTFKLKAPETIKIGLNKNEIIKIEELDLKEGSPIWHTRNVWLFSFYLAGIRISDVLNMKWRDIRDERLYYKMGKNNKKTSLKLNQKVIAILKYYEEDKYEGLSHIFPELKKANKNNPKDVYAKKKTAIKKFNYYLAQIATKAKINKKITNHIARHSFGNIAADSITPHMLQKLYRHSNITTTIGYQSNFINKSADDALDSVINF